MSAPDAEVDLASTQSSDRARGAATVVPDEASTTTIVEETTTSAPTTTAAPTTTVPPTTTTEDPRAALAEAVATWGMEHYWVFDSLVTGTSAVADAGMAMDVPGMLRACADLKALATEAHSALPTPDPALTDLLATAFDDLYDAGDLCVRGVQSMDVDLIDAATAKTDSATDAMSRATDRLTELGG